ncbi:hypothetical protein [Sinomonas sp. P47F7]|uniref:hypothetical protein n=1 Tax=Sinomonas sp. P47F7 TaxID=3410987 RepID=UPI003BF507B8
MIAVSGERERAWIYTIAFLIAFAAAVVLGIDAVRRREQRLSMLPTTRLGWWVIALMAVSALLQPIGTSLQFVAPIFSYGPLIGFALALAAVVAGMLSIVRGGERSAVVLVLTAFPAAFLLYFFIGEAVFPH